MAQKEGGTAQIRVRDAKVEVILLERLGSAARSAAGDQAVVR